MIENDEQYEAMLARVREAPQHIIHPLVTEEKRKKFMDAYDEMCRQIREYRQREHGHL